MIGDRSGGGIRAQFLKQAESAEIGHHHVGQLRGSGRRVRTEAKNLAALAVGNGDAPHGVSSMKANQVLRMSALSFSQLSGCVGDYRKRSCHYESGGARNGKQLVGRKMSLLR